MALSVQLLRPRVNCGSCTVRRCNTGVDVALSAQQGGEQMFRFAPLQSEAGRELLQQCGRATDDISSIVLVEPHQHSIKSEVWSCRPSPWTHALVEHMMPGSKSAVGHLTPYILKWLGIGVSALRNMSYGYGRTLHAREENIL